MSLLGLIITTMLIVAFLSTPITAYTPEALADEIKFLPDAPVLPSRHFSGYVPIMNGTTDVFYYLVTAEKNPETAFTLFVTNGGPGCSSLLGAFTEWGPFDAASDPVTGKAKLVPRTFHWTENFNMLFVEQPDVGFTNIHSGTGPREWTNTETALRNADFIEKFFNKFPNFKSNDFGLLSESFGGVYIPTLLNVILKQEKRFSWLNIKTVIIGNPLIYVPYADFGVYQQLIDRHVIPFFPLGKEYQEICRPDATKQPNPPSPRPSRCDELERQMDRFSIAVDPYAMSFPLCVNSKTGTFKPSSPYHENMVRIRSRVHRHYKQHTMAHTEDLRQQHFESILRKNQDRQYETLLAQMKNGLSKDDSTDYYFANDYEPCAEDNLTEYLNRPDVQAAMHARLLRPSWSMCEPIPYRDFDVSESMIPYYKENHRLNPNIKQYVMSGTDDSICSTIESEMSFFNNGFKQLSQEVVLTPQGQMAGIQTEFEELTLIALNGASHMAPSTRPYFSKYMAEKWVLGK